jgi:hypothetical protein
MSKFKSKEFSLCNSRALGTNSLLKKSYGKRKKQIYYFRSYIDKITDKKVLFLSWQEPYNHKILCKFCEYHPGFCKG